MDWNDIRHFLALARHGSVRAAGADLGVSHSTVARRIEALEAELGTRLFDRSRDGYALTPAGTQMLPAAERVDGEMAGIQRGVVGQDERLAGTVTVTCCDAHVSDMLLDDLTPFCEAHPAIALSMNAEGRSYDLSRREADLAIRALAVDGQPPEYLVGRQVAPLRMASYVATAHEQRLDPALGGSDARWAGVEDRAIQQALIARSGHPELPVWGSFSSLVMLEQVAHHGLALVMLPVYVGDRIPTLRRLTDRDLGQVGSLWLLYHPDLRRTARVQAIRDRIAGCFARNADRFAGERITMPRE